MKKITNKDQEPESDYININRQLWDDKVDAHFNSDFYEVRQFIEGKTSLNEFELDLLGDVANLDALHLQCHFGMDTLSLARMGANVTGMDLSPKAIEKAEVLKGITQLPAHFVCSDVYNLPENLKGKFDLIFTSYGTIGWLPDLDRWAAVVKHFLKKGGRFLIVEFHPVVWMFANDFSKIEYSYFNRIPIVETTTGTYADRDAPIQGSSVSWNHDLSEVMTALMNQGLSITQFREFDYSPYNCFENTVEFEPGKFQIKGLEGLIPMVYGLLMVNG